MLYLESSICVCIEKKELGNEYCEVGVGGYKWDKNLECEYKMIF